jgi:RNA polymerase sigma factor (sigma-70 family)
MHEPAFLSMISEESQRETFARIFAQHHRWLYAYLMSILADVSSTEEVFQEVCVVLWREFGKFDPNTDFRRWASVIARHKVYQFRRSAVGKLMIHTWNPLAAISGRAAQTRAATPAWYSSKRTSGLSVTVEPGYNELNSELTAEYPPQ